METLTVGLASNRLTGTAVGLLMGRYGLDREAAFQLLRRMSQDANVKLVEIARTLVEDAERRA